MSSQASKTFVLVAGAGHGGWVWRELREGLLAAGHRVFTPTLTGVGERSHLLSSEITLSTHIDDVANLFLWEDLQDVILVGHSYAGWVISGAVEKLEGRVNAIVYLDAFLPEDQNRGLDFLNEKQKEAFSQALERNEASRAGPTSAALRIQDPVKAAWVDSKITPQPIGVSLERLQLTGARERVPSKLYVRTPLFPQPYFDEALARCEADPSWRTAILPDCGHDPMVDRPDLVMNLLLSMS
ncbi:MULTISPECIES: alpha/beta fold hydrolase [unclassified Rhizobium]|uniref:alpha/beta fold hydrolase n=1 Tax=unclassified Rhizobium TaxID=2613769 RepID=UPI0018D7E6F6|nr:MULTISPECIES: alpha/beta fold hydrolase [unclassified Rhizobium]